MRVLAEDEDRLLLREADNLIDKHREGDLAPGRWRQVDRSVALLELEAQQIRDDGDGTLVDFARPQQQCFEPVEIFVVGVAMVDSADRGELVDGGP